MPEDSTFSRSSLISACCGIVLAQLALDRLQLLAEDVLPLGLVHLGLDLALDLALQLEDLDLAGEEPGDELQPLRDVDRLEQLLALLGRHVGAVGHHVGQQAGLGDVAGGDGGLGRHGRAVGHVLLDLRLDAAHERLDLDALGRLVLELLDARREVRPMLAKPWTRMRPWPWTMARTVPSWSWTTWAILAMVPTGYSSEGSLMSSCSGWRWVTSAIGPPASVGGVERGDALLPPHLERNDHLREDDRLPEGDERQLTQLGRAGLCCSSSSGVDGRLAIRVSLDAGRWAGDGAVRFGFTGGGGWVGGVAAVSGPTVGRPGSGVAAERAASSAWRSRPPRGSLRRRGPRGCACRGAPRARTASGPRRD